MSKWLIRLCVALVLVSCAACGGQPSHVPSGAPDPKEKMKQPPGPPPLPKPPADAPRR
jgi:hypothetical protein